MTLAPRSEFICRTCGQSRSQRIEDTPPRAHAAAVCADYANQAAAQRAADTIDSDGDGIYCESLPCPCLKPGAPAPTPQPTRVPAATPAPTSAPSPTPAPAATDEPT